MHWWTLFRVKLQLHWWNLLRVKLQLHWWTRFCESNFFSLKFRNVSLLTYTKRWFAWESNRDVRMQAYRNTARSSQTFVHLRLPFLMTYNEQKSGVIYCFDMWRSQGRECKHFYLSYVMPCTVVEISWRFGGTRCLHLRSRMSATCFSETSVNFYHTRQRTIMCFPEAWNRSWAGPTFACTYQRQHE